MAATSTTRSTAEKGFAGFADALYIPRRGIQHQFGLDWFDDTIDINDVGFRGRNDIRGARYALGLTRAGMKRVRMWRSNVSYGRWVNAEGRIIRDGMFGRSSFMFYNRSEIRTEFNFFPARWDDIESRGNGAYRTGDRLQLSLAYGTDSSRPFSWSVQGGSFQEELDGYEYRGGFGFTLKPSDRFSFDFDVIYSHREHWLIHQGGGTSRRSAHGTGSPRSPWTSS